MFRKIVFNCFKICLLVVICTAAPSRKTTPKRHKNDYADPFQLPDDRTSDENADFNISGIKLQGPALARQSNRIDEKNNDSDERSGEQLSDVTQDEEVKGDNKGEHFPVADDKTIAPLKAEEVSDQTDHEKNEAVDDEVKEADSKKNIDIEDPEENNENLPSPSDNKDETVQNPSKLCSHIITYSKKNFNSIPSFKLDPDEIKKFKIWPKATVPYYIDRPSYGKALRDKIRAYLDGAGLLSGLNFQELRRLPDEDVRAFTRYVFFVNRRGELDCQDYTTESFTSSGAQKVVLGYNCLDKHRYLASVVLALAGVPPQHNAPDRDRFVNVSMDSILPHKKHFFTRITDGNWLFHDVKYDFNSAGHFPSHKYTFNGFPTVSMGTTSLDPDEENDSFSYIDIKKMRMLYNNILQSSPHGKVKLSYCMKLFPDYSSGNTKLINTQNIVPVQPKPKRYLAAIGKSNKTALNLKDMYGEVLSDLNS